MTQVSITTISADDALEAAPVQGNFESIRDVLNGDVDANNLSATTRQKMGLSDDSTVRRGSSIVATTEGTASTSFTTLTTPDQVASVSVPSPGLLTVFFEAQWLGDGNSQAAIFLNETQVQVIDATAGTIAVQKASHPGGGTPFYNVLYATAGGLATTSAGADVAADVTTGQALHSDGCRIRVAAGSYTVSIRFRNTTGAFTTIRSRDLYVKAEGY